MIGVPMTVLLHDLGHLWKLILQGSCIPIFSAPHLDSEQDAHVVDDCRIIADKRSSLYFMPGVSAMINAAAPINRRHQLSADRTGRNNGACEFVVIAGFFL